MIAKQPARKIEFNQQDEDFVSKLATDIGCFFCKSNGRTYNLNKYNSPVNSEMGIFAWVHKEAEDYFWVTTRRVWVEAAKSSALAAGIAARMACFPRGARDGDSVFLDTKDGYQKTVRALKLVNEVR